MIWLYSIPLAPSHNTQTIAHSAPAILPLFLFLNFTIHGSSQSFCMYSSLCQGNSLLKLPCGPCLISFSSLLQVHLFLKSFSLTVCAIDLLFCFTFVSFIKNITSYIINGQYANRPNGEMSGHYDMH